MFCRRHREDSGPRKGGGGSAERCSACPSLSPPNPPVHTVWSKPRPPTLSLFSPPNSSPPPLLSLTLFSLSLSLLPVIRWTRV